MYDPHNNQFVPLNDQLRNKFATATLDELTPRERVQREWTRFEEGETVELKGVKFRVHEIGETRLVLKPIKSS